MSWSLAIPNNEGYIPQSALPAESGRVLEANKATIEANNPGGFEQAEAACDAAADLIASGVLGTGPVRLQLNGHANPNHTPPPGWAADYITVSVYTTG